MHMESMSDNIRDLGQQHTLFSTPSAFYFWISRSQTIYLKKNLSPPLHPSHPHKKKKEAFISFKCVFVMVKDSTNLP